MESPIKTRKIKTWRNPYAVGFSTCRPREIEIQEGLTVLVGCNGAGKTTLIENIKDKLRDLKIPYADYNNLHDGGHNSVSQFFYEDISLASALWSASEGESININLGIMSSKIDKFLKDGLYIKDERSYKITEAFKVLMSSEQKEKEEIIKERWILLDAVDSGLSIDNVIDLKKFFNILLEESKKLGLILYIIVAANEYELVDGSNCMDVTNGKYITFKDYNEFKKFIIKSRLKKDKRIIKSKEND